MSDPALTLFWSARSPYVRKVMIAVHELGLANRLVLKPAVNTPVSVDTDLVGYNPVGKIPTLLLPSGEAVFDSLLICQALDDLGSSILFPPKGEPLRRAMRLHTVGDGLLDGAFRLFAETMRPGDAMSAPMKALPVEKISRCTAWLEGHVEMLDAGRPGIGEISVAAGLSYLDFRCGSLVWRSDRPALSAWYATMAERPSMKASEFDLQAVMPLTVPEPVHG